MHQLSFFIFYFVVRSTFKMENKEALQTVKEIKALMEKSSKFLSFSGLSIILIGVFALIGASVARRILLPVKAMPGEYTTVEWFGVAPKLMVVAVLVFVLALTTVFLFAAWKSKKMRQPFFNKVTYRTFVNFLLPLSAGGIFCVALLFNGNVGIIAPAMLLFYGLSLINVSKFTYGNIFWLGCCEMILGLLCAFFPGKGLLFWSLGFGFLHILFGVYFYLVVERKEKLA